MNKYYQQEILYTILGNVSYFYEKNKKSYNKKCKDFIMSLPFVIFPDESKNELFKIIIDNPIDSYLDSQDDLKKYCFYIYKKFSMFLSLEYDDYEKFHEQIKFKIENDNQVIREIRYKYIKMFIFLFIMIFIIVIYHKYL